MIHAVGTVISIRRSVDIEITSGEGMLPGTGLRGVSSTVAQTPHSRRSTPRQNIDRNRGRRRRSCTAHEQPSSQREDTIPSSGYHCSEMPWLLETIRATAFAPDIKALRLPDWRTLMD